MKKIHKHKLGLRSGEGLVGAAYAMSDFGDALNGTSNDAKGARIQHIINPPRGGAWEREWATRYFTTVKLIKQFRPAGLLQLVSGAFPGAERYRHDGAETFKKANRLRADTETFATIDYVAGDSARDIMRQVTAALDGLPDPGGDFLL
ncbi:MAG TPA: hypothetical protein VF584_24060 [Longimicrobium sp.]